MTKEGRKFGLALACAVAFALGNAPSASAWEGFGSPFTHRVGELPVHAAAGDLNADGLDDLIVPNFSTSDISVLLATPGGGFEPAVSYRTEDGPFAAAIGDLNGDGRPDLAVAALNEGVSVLLAKGDGAFEPAVDYLDHSVSNAPVSVAIGDLNGDGRADLAVSETFLDCVWLLHGDGSGAFEPAGCLAVGHRPERLAVGDLNGDGRADLAVATEAAVEVLLASPGGGFDARSAYPAGNYPFDVAIGDLNSDGRPDLAVANFEAAIDDNRGYMSVLLAKEHGGYQSPTDYQVGSRAEGVAISDLNLDGRLDVVVANYASGAAGGLSILLGAPGGGLSPETRYAAGSWSRAVAVGDFNGDGWPDLAAPNDTPNTVSVIYNGGGPLVRLSVDALAFAPQTVGTVSAAETVTVTNTGSAPLAVSSVTVVGADAEAFEVSGEGCTAPAIPQAAACDIQVRFRPGKPGLARAALQVASDAPSSPAVVPLSGLGSPQLPLVPPVVELPPITLLDLGGSTTVECKHRRAGRRKAKVDCSVTAPAADGDRMVSARLMRAKRIYASRQRILRAGRERVSLKLGRAVNRSRYVLVVELRDGGGRRTSAKRRVDLRR